MKNRPTQAIQRRQSTERGATMVEFAIVAIALFTLIFGIIEGGFGVRARSAVHNATDDAARRGAIAANNSNADWLILQQLIGRGATDFTTVEYVTVYKATSGSNGPNPGCIGDSPSPIDGECNVYFPDSFGAAESEFDCGSSVLDGNWCPRTRGGDGSGIEFLGVYVKAKYEPIVGTLFVDMEFDIAADSLQAIETSGEL